MTYSTSAAGRGAGPRLPRRLASVGLVAAVFGGGLAGSAIAASTQDAAAPATKAAVPTGAELPMMVANLIGKLDQAGATPEQKNRIVGILARSVLPMVGAGGAAAELQQSFATLKVILTAPTVDRGALERLRTADLARLDEFTKTLFEAMAEAAEVLTPAQRAKFAATSATPSKP